MAKKYLFRDNLSAVSPDEAPAPGEPVVEVLSPAEFARLGIADADTLDALHSLAVAENTYLDVFPESLVGSFAVPDKQNVMGDPLRFAFYLGKLHLVFIDEGDVCQRVMDEVSRQRIVKSPTVAHCLFEFIKLLVKDDLSFLARLEDKMEDVEEGILDNSMSEANRTMLGFRRKLLRIDTYYQQLADLASLVAENENRLLTRGEAHLFLLLANQIDRLLKRSQTLKEYSLQLRELYQTQIDIQQNVTMKLFTVITMLFAPLTLITSWFGMNFADMPGLDSRWGYYAVIGLAIAIIVMELVIFKRKKWL